VLGAEVLGAEVLGAEVLGAEVLGATHDGSALCHFVADLAREYGFTDVDGRMVPRFKPFG
jgi:hypothetical protein